MAAVILAGCSGGKQPPGEIASTGASLAPAETSASPSRPAALAEPTVPHAAPAFEFGYQYPAAVRVIPALRLILDGEQKAVRASIASQAEQAREDARASGFPFHTYIYTKTWRVVTDLPGWLSLSAQIYTFTGGAHGMSFFDALVWNKAAGKRGKAADLFESREALSQAIRAPFCDALDRLRAQKRGKPVRRGSGDMFDKCIDPMDETLILGSAGGRAFDRIGVLVAPYDAGPYAEGAYEVTLPVTPAILAATRPEYRRYFSLAR